MQNPIRHRGAIARSGSNRPFGFSRVVKNDFLLRISIVCLQLRWRRRKNPQRIAEDTPAVFSSSPPRFVKTLKMLTTEPFFTTVLDHSMTQATSQIGALTVLFMTKNDY